LIPFVRILLTLGSGDRRSFIVIFALGIVAVGMTSNLAYDWVTDPAGLPWTARLWTLAAVAACILIAYLVYRFSMRLEPKQSAFRANVDVTRLAPARSGLILFMSKGKIDLPLMIIEHHLTFQTGDPLQHCWALATPEALDAYQQLQAALVKAGHAHDLVTLIPIKDAGIETAYQAVIDLLEQDVIRAGLKRTQVVVDFTGGLKPLTVGATLASILEDVALEYVESDYDADGNLILGSHRVVGVDVGFFMK
jgi:sensor histidine kinase regulating citrate/malate metabolism